MQLEGENAKNLLVGMASAMGKASPNPRRRSGEECPECQAALQYTELGVIHQEPPRRRVACSACDYQGFHYLEEVVDGG